MAETVKKSRIVSDSDDNLEESLMEEFNLRLKNCMSQDDLQEADADAYENVEVIKANGRLDKEENGDSKGGPGDPSRDFIQIERDNCCERPGAAEVAGVIKMNGHGARESADDNETIQQHQSKTDFCEKYDVSSCSSKVIPVEDQNLDSNVYEPVEPRLSIPDVTFQLPVESNEESLDSKSVKDRMFLSTDDASCLLFTQTVTSPMLTPSEENIDFLKGFRRESTSTQNTSSDNSNSRSDGTGDRHADVIDTTENEIDAIDAIDLTPPSEIIDLNQNEDGRPYEETPKEEHPTEEKLQQHVKGTQQNEQKIEEETGVEEIEENEETRNENEETPIEDYQIKEKAATDVIENVRAGIDVSVDDKKDEIPVGDLLSDFEETPEITAAQNGLPQSPRNEEIIYENTQFLKTSEEEIIYENLKQASRQIEESENVYENIDEIRRQIDAIDTVEWEEAMLADSEAIVTDPDAMAVDSGATIIGSDAMTIDSKAIILDTKAMTVDSNAIIVGSKPMIVDSKAIKVDSHSMVVDSNATDIDSKPLIVDEPDSEAVIPEVSPSQLVETIKSQLLKSPETKEAKDVRESTELNELKALNIMKQISRFENIDADCASATSVSSQISESTYVETSTVVETKTAAQEKSLKKKKSRSHEKENISVSETNSSIEESYYNVNVKSLCRSFGDLTKIGDEKCSMQKRAKTKSSFSKFDALQKKNVLHVRSSDSTKAQEKFNGSQIDNSSCKSCSKPVFQMEQVKAEKAIWHRNCFRCHECNKQLTVDTYESNEGTLYCKPHFRALFAPKVVEDDTPTKPKKHELIIRENQPKELPPDVVRASDKPDLGLEELQSLNVKERFHVFEQHESETNQLERTPSAVNVKRSPSILSKLARFQAKGMDIGVADDALNGIPIEESSSEEEEEEEIVEGEDADLIRAKRAQKEKPFHFVGMSDVKSKWEQGDQQYKDERREERKQEIQTIRNRLFMGKQGKMKEAYQQAVKESEAGANVKKAGPVEVCDTTRSLKERFEKGDVHGDEQNREKEQEDMEVFESAISKKSRSIFLELDANASKAPQMSPITPPKLMDVKKTREVFLQHQTSEDVVKSSEQVDDVAVRTADIQQRFKFFETYKEPEKQRREFRITPPREGQVKAQTPEREVYRDPEVIRAEEYVEDSVVAKESHTATKMLNKFRQMEEDMTKEAVPAGPKPLKCFTPPPEPARHESSSGEEESGSEEESEENEPDHASKVQDEDLIEAQKAARAKQLRAKFERWEANEIRREQNNSSVNIAEEIGEESQIESTKSLRARFESMRENKNDPNRTARVKVNRFVDLQTSTETCQGCGGRVYPLEKLSVHGHIYHKGCFKCMECSTVLRMDSYSYNQGLLYCMPHFKRLFISKGNYDSAFGLGQRKDKWNTQVA